MCLETTKLWIGNEQARLKYGHDIQSNCALHDAEKWFTYVRAQKMEPVQRR